jgi:hypothetical protein
MEWQQSGTMFKNHLLPADGDIVGFPGVTVGDTVGTPGLRVGYPVGDPGVTVGD